MLGTDYRFPSLALTDVVFRNNLVSDLSGANWGGAGQLLLTSGGTNLTIDHNTVFTDGTSVVYADGPQVFGFVFTNNIIPDNEWGVMGSAVAEGTATLNLFFPGWTFNRNIVVGGQPSTYPSGNYYPSAISGVGFVDVNGNYRLSPSSPYFNAATDGGAIGANIPAINSASGTSMLTKGHRVQVAQDWRRIFRRARLHVGSTTRRRKRVRVHLQDTRRGLPHLQDAEPRWRQFEPLHEVDRHAEKVQEHRAQRVGVRHDSHHFAWMPGVKVEQRRYRAHLHVDQRLAGRRAGDASKRVVQLPVRVAGQIGESTVRPAAEVDFDEARFDFYPQAPRIGDRLRGLPGPLERAGVDGGNRHMPKIGAGEALALPGLRPAAFRCTPPACPVIV